MRINKVIIASDSFKGSLSSLEVASSAKEAILGLNPSCEVVCVNVADGGEGTVEAVISSIGGEIVEAIVSDPLGRPVAAKYGMVGDLAVIESAAACGLVLLSENERNPLLTDTKGLGELLMDAINRGCKRFIVGLGGSATNDGGKGMVSVPGLLEAMKDKDITVACDVDTPFIGPKGASRVFAPQKGASPEDVEILEERLVEYSKVIKAQTGVDVSDMAGAGAAGGLGGAFAAFFGARLVPGIQMVLDAIGFDSIIAGADLIITGEGKSDFQTPKGKTPAGVLERASKQDIPVALVSGKIDMCPELERMNFKYICQSTPEGMPLEEAMKKQTAMNNVKAAVKSFMLNMA